MPHLLEPQLPLGVDVVALLEDAQRLEAEVLGDRQVRDGDGDSPSSAPAVLADFARVELGHVPVAVFRALEHVPLDRTEHHSGVLVVWAYVFSTLADGDPAMSEPVREDAVAARGDGTHLAVRTLQGAVLGAGVGAHRAVSVPRSAASHRDRQGTEYRSGALGASSSGELHAEASHHDGRRHPWSRTVGELPQAKPAR